MRQLNRMKNQTLYDQRRRVYKNFAWKTAETNGTNHVARACLMQQWGYMGKSVRHLQIRKCYNTLVTESTEQKLCLQRRRLRNKVKQVQGGEGCGGVVPGAAAEHTAAAPARRGTTAMECPGCGAAPRSSPPAAIPRPSAVPRSAQAPGEPLCAPRPENTMTNGHWSHMIFTAIANVSCIFTHGTDTHQHSMVCVALFPPPCCPGCPVRTTPSIGPGILRPGACAKVFLPPVARHAVAVHGLLGQSLAEAVRKRIMWSQVSICNVQEWGGGRSRVGGLPEGGRRQGGQHLGAAAAGHGSLQHSRPGHLRSESGAASTLAVESRRDSQRCQCHSGKTVCAQ